jgi:hypothetical protein
MKKRNLLDLIILILVVTLVVCVYVYLADLFQVHYCMDQVQENIELIRDHIAKVQN